MPTILYVQYSDPAAYPPLERSAWQFADAGWRVRFIGIRLKGGAGQLAFVRHENISVRLLPQMPRGPLGRLGYARFVSAVLAEIAATRPDVVYCSDDRTYPIGLAASYLPGIRTVLHEHDSPLPHASGRLKTLQAIRRRFARRASICVIPQDERAEIFRRETGAPRVAVAHNCPALREVGPPPRHMPRPGLTLWHHGSLGPGRMPFSIIQALARLPDDVRLEFAGYETVSTRGFIDRVMQMASELGIAHRVAYLGALPARSELYDAARRADVGLVLFESRFVEPMVGASNKPFDFLACGLPLLTNATAEWRDFFGTAGVARLCNPDDPDAIAREISWYRDNAEARRRMAERGYELVRTRWNYERAFEGVLRQLSDAKAAA